MFKCICGHSSYSKSSMKSHMQSCRKVKRELKETGVYGSGMDVVIDSILFDSLCCDTTTDFSGSDYSSAFSGGGGDFGGGGSSGDY